MRLTITLTEMEEGVSTQSGPTERMIDLDVLVKSRSPVAIIPIMDHDHRIISAILLLSGEYYGNTNTIRIRFKPFWCRLFTLCSAKKDSLLALIVQLGDGQYWVDNSGWKESNLTLDGPGTDPKTVHNAQYMLGELLANYPRPRLLDTVIDLIREKSLLPSHAAV